MMSNGLGVLGLRNLTLTLAVIGMTGACGSSAESGTPGDGSPISVKDLPAKYAAAYCEAMRTCFGGAWDFYGPAGKGEDCVVLYTRMFEDSQLSLLDAMLADGVVTYDERAAASCVADLRTGGCKCLGATAPEACDSAVEGSVARGETCSTDLECTGDDYCANTSCPGVCTAKAAAGAACVADRNCASGLVCGASICEKPLTSGSACDDATAAKCDIGTACLDGACKPIKDLFTGEPGAACSTENFCKAELSCVFNGADTSGNPTGTCEAKVAAGSSCSVALPDQCPAGQYCAGIDLEVTPPIITGTCSPAPGAGDACGGGLNAADLCGPYLRCVAGVCTEMQRLGGSCSERLACYSSECQAGTCAVSGACEAP